MAAVDWAVADWGVAMAAVELVEAGWEAGWEVALVAGATAAGLVAATSQAAAAAAMPLVAAAAGRSLNSSHNTAVCLLQHRCSRH